VAFPVDATNAIFSPALAIAAPASSYLRCQNFTVSLLSSSGFDTGLISPVWTVSVVNRYVNKTILQNGKNVTV
jgi:hypothetical protein